MERIASFSVDHRVLEPGVYVSRRDSDAATGCTTTTFDLRMTAPNREPVMDTAAVHAIEHLGATSYAYAARPDGALIAIELGDRRGLRAGDALAVVLPPERTLLFDKDTGRRVRAA